MAMTAASCSTRLLSGSVLDGRTARAARVTLGRGSSASREGVWARGQAGSWHSYGTCPRWRATRGWWSVPRRRRTGESSLARLRSFGLRATLGFGRQVPEGVSTQQILGTTRHHEAVAQSWDA